MSKSIPNDFTLPWLPPWNCQMVNIPKFWAKRWRIMSLSNIALRLAKTWAQYLFWQGAFIQYNHPKEFAQGLQVSLSQISWIDYRHHSTILPARMGPKIVHGFSALLRRDCFRALWQRLTSFDAGYGDDTCRGWRMNSSQIHLSSSMANLAPNMLPGHSKQRATRLCSCLVECLPASW